LGKAEAGSAGEQPVRNSPCDWNGQKGWGFTSTFFYFNRFIPRAHASKNSFLL